MILQVTYLDSSNTYLFIPTRMNLALLNILRSIGKRTHTNIVIKYYLSTIKDVVGYIKKLFIT